MMIEVHRASMSYPVTRRYREYLLHPFRPRSRADALHDIELRVDPGTRLALVGPNGAGKTSLLKMIGGLLYPTTGGVRIAGIDTVDDNAEVRRRVGLVVNEERSFYWRLTGAQNLEFFGVLENLHGKPLRRRIVELLEMVGLAAAGDRRVSDYSSGMKQRLAIARGLLSDPRVLLLDEPTRSLDILGSVEIRQLIAEQLSGHDRTLVVATNRIEDVLDLCDRLVIIRRGRIADDVELADADADLVLTTYRRAVESPAR